MSRRRLKPIYDLLEAGNNKKVVTEIDKQLAKGPQTIKKSVITADDEDELTIVIAKALKSLALVRLARAEEADKLFNELLTLNIIEDNALSVMMQYCRETQQISKIVAFYENAVKKDDQNEDLQCSLYYAYARTQNFSQQLKPAIALRNSTKRSVYLYWQALSYIMACEENDMVATQLTEQQKTMNLTLGEKILSKAYEESKAQQQQQSIGSEVMFYVSYLEKRGKYEEALKVVGEVDDSKVGVINYKIKSEINLLNKLARYDECRRKLEEYLEREGTHSDDWSHLKLYLEICLKLSVNVVDIVDYLNRFKSGPNKGPYLAVIDLYQQLLDKNGANENDLKENLRHLVDRYHYKPGFYFDLVYFSKIIAKFNLKTLVLRQIEDYLGARLGLEYEKNDEGTRLDKLKQWPRRFQAIDHVYSYITYWQLYRHYDLHLNLNQDQVLEIIAQLQLAYENGLEFGKELVDTTQQFSDEIAMLKLHFKYDLLRFVATTGQKSQILLSIIGDVNNALIKSKANYQLKLYLVNLYSNIGVYSLLQKNFNAMEIKNIQYYSMSHLIMHNCLRLGSYEQCSDILGLIRHFYMTNLFDNTTYMINCYKYGTFDKLFDLYKFMLSVRKSLNINLSLQDKFLVKNLFNVNETAGSVGLVASVQAVQASLETLSKQFDAYFHDVQVNAYLKDQLDFALQFDNGNLCDHNDRTVLQYWLSDAQADLNVHGDYKDLLDEQKSLLVYRNFYLKFLHLALKASLGEVDAANQLDKLMGNLDRFELTLKFCDLNVNDLAASYTAKPVNQLLSSKSRYLEILFKYQFACLTSTLSKRLFIKVFQQREGYFANELNNEQNKNLTLCLGELKCFLEGFRSQLSSNSSANLDAITSNSFLIEYLAAACEQVSLQVYLFIIAVYNLLPYWQEKCSKKKSSKKKKQFYLDFQSSVDQFYEIYELYTAICQHTVEFLSKTIKGLGEQKVEKTEEGDECLVGILSKSNAEFCLLSSDLRESYVSTYQQLLTQFEFKQKQLQNLLNL